jgi:hypothetical protein
VEAAFSALLKELHKEIHIKEVTEVKKSGALSLQYDFEEKEVVLALLVRRFRIIGLAIAIQQLTL